MAAAASDSPSLEMRRLRRQALMEQPKVKWINVIDNDGNIPQVKRHLVKMKGRCCPCQAWVQHALAYSTHMVKLVMPLLLLSNVLSNFAAIRSNAEEGFLLKTAQLQAMITLVAGCLASAKPEEDKSMF